MNAYTLDKLSHLLKVGIFRMEGDFWDKEHEKLNPLYQSEVLRKKLIEEAAVMDVPRVYRDDFRIYYACVRDGDVNYLIGPMATEYLNRVRRHEYYKQMGVDLDLDKNLHLFTPEEAIQVVCLFANLATGAEYSDEEIEKANSLTVGDKDELRVGEIRYSLKSEDDEEDYRHTYQEERELLAAVREGNVEEALKRNKDMDTDIGKLSASDVDHWKHVLIVGVTLCTRAAIEGGVAPFRAYKMSGYYINKGTASKDPLQILFYRNRAVEELTTAVRDLKVQRHTSSYTQQCKDYVRKHYREKIYLDEIATQMGISSSYLSRLFKKETGKNLQDYIVDIRVEKAANLLIYSEEPLPRIAEYVNFPSQSYFGRVFKEHKHMTPREYREMYKPTEFIEKDKAQEK